MIRNDTVYRAKVFAIFYLIFLKAKASNSLMFFAKSEVYQYDGQAVAETIRAIKEHKEGQSP